MLLTASSAWAKDATIDGINYKIYSGYAIVGSNKTFAGPTVNIPDKIKYNNKSYDVTQIEAGAFKDNTNITSVNIGGNVQIIYERAFRGCTNLATLTFSTGTNIAIYDESFKGCGLTSLSIPSSVTSIGEKAFDSSTGPFVLNSNPKLGKKAFPMGSATVTMNLTANGPVDGYYWTTFYNDYPTSNFQADESTKVYKGTISGSSLVLTEVSRNNTEFKRIVDSGTAVILKSTSSHPVMTMTEDPSSDTHGNDLQGVMERTLTSELGSGTPYVMGKVGSDFGFFQYTADYMPAGKAYLLVSGSAPEFLGFDENATGITPPLIPRGGRRSLPSGRSGRGLVHAERHAPECPAHPARPVYPQRT